MSQIPGVGVISISRSFLCDSGIEECGRITGELDRLSV